MPSADVRQYEARCACGNRWRVYRNDVHDDDNPMATCVNCGADTFDLTDIGEVHSVGHGGRPKPTPETPRFVADAFLIFDARAGIPHPSNE
jgi:hypothetical protein